MSEEITFMPGWWASSNSSQYGLEVGVFWRLIFSRTDLLAISLSQLAGPFEHQHGRRQRVASSIPTDRKPTPLRSAIRDPGALLCCACRLRATGHIVLPNTTPVCVTRAFCSALESRQTSLLHRVVLPRPRRNQRSIHRFELKLRLIGVRSGVGFRRVQKVLVVTLGGG